MHGSEPADNDATELLSLPDRGGDGDVLEPGARLGAYVIRRVLGEGGMGCVYLAEQLQPVRREVALKLIREQVASPLARAYFDVERQALAQMHHPAIAQVFDAGTTEQGHPYLAMEVVEGEPITRFCRTASLDRSERLALFARVCNGVQHAHQKGIIHRDLKPANVLVREVDGVPMPKIIDFGIAIGGVVDDGGIAAHATAADQAGTAIYMSPEQAMRQPRDIDTRSDVYSLGVMLYEILTDADAAALATVAHDSRMAPHATLLAAIDSDGPAAASPAPDALLAAARGLPRELRAILRKALAEDRADRYDSAAALADDLERHRHDQPINALPRTRGYVARKFVARHRLALAAAGLVALALVAGIAMALHGQAQARLEAVRAAQVSEFVRGILSGIDPDRARGMDTTLMRVVLEDAAVRADRELAARPDIRSEIEDTVGAALMSLGEYTRAVDHYRAALAAALQANLPVTRIARAEMRVADALVGVGRMDEAIESAHAAMARVASLPAENRDRLRIESGLASVELDRGDLESARDRLLRILPLQRKVAGDADGDTLNTIETLANADSNSARYDEARALFKELIAARRVQLGEENSATLSAINGLAVVELEQRNFAEAERLLAPQAAIVERVFGPEHPRTITLLANLGGAIRQQGRQEEARPIYERVVELATKVYGPGNPRTRIAQSNLSLLLAAVGDTEQALRYGRMAVDSIDNAFGTNALRGVLRREYAVVLIQAREFAAAERELEMAWSVFLADPAYGADHPRAQDVVASFVALYEAWGRPERAREWEGRRVGAGTAVTRS